MATTQDLVYRVTVNDRALDRLIAKTATLNSTLYSSSAAFKPLDAQLRGMGRRTTEIGRYLTRNVTQPLLLAAGVATKLGYDFEKSFGRISSLAGASANEMVKFRKEVMALGKTSPTSVQELSDALYFIRSSGFKADEAMKVLNASNMAAVAGMGDVKTVADTVTSAMNAYGHANLSAERATDILLATVRVGKAEPAELARAIGRVIPIAQQMKVGFDEVGGAIAGLTLSGLSADQAVTALRATLSTFGKLLQPTQFALAKLGLTGEQVQKAIGKQGLAATFNSLKVRVNDYVKRGGTVASDTMEALRAGSEEGAKSIAKLEKSIGTTATSLLAKLFPNIKALNAFLILTKKNGQDVADVFGEVRESQGETRTDYAERMSQQWAKLATALNKIRTEVTEIGTSILPVITRLAEGAGKVAAGFNWLPGWLKSLIGLNTVLIALVGPLLSGFGLLVRLTSAYVAKQMANGRKLIGMQKGQTTAVGQTAAAQTALTDTVVTGAAAEVKAIQSVTAAYLAQAAAARGVGGAALGSVLGVTAMGSAAQRQREIAALARRDIGLAGGGFRLYRQGPYEGPLKGDPRFAGGERGYAGSVKPAFQGPGGAPILFSKIAPEMEAVDKSLRSVDGQMQRNLKSVGKFKFALGGLATAARGVGVALGAAMAYVWPIALIEGTLLLWQNWDKLSDTIYEATGRLANFFKQKMPGGGGITKALSTYNDTINNLVDRGPLKGHGFLQGLLKLPTGTFLSAFYNSGKKNADEQERATKAVEKQKTFVAEMAKFYGVSEAEVRRILGMTSGIAGNLKTARDALKTAFGQLADDLLRAFDAATERMVDNIKVSVTALGRTFKIGMTGLTPAEKELKALDKIQTKRRLMEAVQDARERLREAKGRKLTEVKIGRYIYGFVDRGDKEEQRSAQRSLRDANDDLRRYGLEQRAEIERTAADKALAQAEKNLRARRELERRHFEKSLEQLQLSLATGRVTVEQAQIKLKNLMAQYKIDVHQTGIDIGVAFKQGLAESFKEVFDLLARVRRAIVVIQGVREAARGGTGGKAAPVPAGILGPATWLGVPVKKGGGGEQALFPAYSPDNPFAVPYQPAVNIQALYVTSPAQAELIANTIARKATRR